MLTSLRSDIVYILLMLSVVGSAIFLAQQVYSALIDIVYRSRAALWRKVPVSLVLQRSAAAERPHFLLLVLHIVRGTDEVSCW